MHRSEYEGGGNAFITFYLAIEKTAKPLHFYHVTFSFEKSVATVAVESLCSLGSDCVDIIDCRLFPENSLLYIHLGDMPIPSHWH